MTLIYQRFTAVSLLFYSSLFLNCIYYCLHMFWCAAAKQRRVTICQDLLERQDDILGRAITSDEIWVYQYDPESKRQSAQWKTANSPRPKKVRQSKSRVKIMLRTFFFWYERDCSLWICTNWTNSQPSLLFGSAGTGAWKSYTETFSAMSSRTLLSFHVIMR